MLDKDDRYMYHVKKVEEEIPGELAITPGGRWHVRGEKRLGTLRDKDAPTSESEEQQSMSWNRKRRRNRWSGLLFNSNEAGVSAV